MTTEIALTRGLVALIDDEDYQIVCALRWHAQANGRRCYAVNRGPREDGGRQHVIRMHRLIMAVLDHPEIQIDHINGDGLDNRRKNLRPATNSQNQANRVKHRAASSHFKGVHWDAHSGMWQSGITHQDKFHLIGSFDDEEEAARAYDNVARILRGEYARTNFDLKGEAPCD